MSGMMPFFLNGAVVKVKINGLTAAYCADFSYNIVVNRISAKVLGLYEASSIEPVGYTVTGSFTLVRYAKGAREAILAAKGKVPQGVHDRGNGIGAFFDGRSTNETQASDSLDPSTFQFASGFDLEVFQKIAGTQLEVAKIRNAHISRAAMALNKRSPGMQQFEFIAQYADEDSFRADFSGIGQSF